MVSIIPYLLRLRKPEPVQTLRLQTLPTGTNTSAVLIKNAAKWRGWEIKSISRISKVINYFKMKKFLLVFALAFVAFTQMSLAANPVVNVYVTETIQTSNYYKIIVAILDVNNNPLGTPTSYPLSTGTQLPFLVSSYSVPINLTQPNPSPQIYCRVYVRVTLTDDTFVAQSVSEWMSFEDVTTNAEWVKITLP